ncbi:hypothetical protein [uncultured Mediterranean phage uvDeep-CGR2-KM21-C338]|nr:hypothetical protein [uncultured Mediterranean phage uvDeep-CGR2-KM21-C338]
MAITYTVESLSRAYAGRVPWDKAQRDEGLSERAAITLRNRLSRLYSDGTSWSGHVRVVGTDDWTYDVERGWAPGSRSKLVRIYHLDDLS